MRERAGRPMLLIDLAVPRDIDAACAEPRRHLPVRHRRPAGGGRPQPPGPPGRGAQGRGDHRGGDPAVRRLAGLARGAADAGGAARPTPPRSPSRWSARTRASGRPPRRATSSGSRPSPGRWSTACCTSPRVRMKEMRDDRVHARMALVRDLFGLSVDEDALGRLRGRRRRSSPTSSPRWPRFASCRAPARPAPAGPDADRNARQRAGAGAGRVGRASCWAATTEIVQITTLGDRGAAALDKSRWVSELERALLDGPHRRGRALGQGRAHRAPGRAGAGGDPRARRRPRRDLRRLGAGALAPGRAGRHQQRAPRRPDLRAVRDDLEVVELRGNVDTRLRKLADGEVDALVLALAGLQRLGREAEAGGVLDELVPAAGQGALALEARAGALDPAALRAGHRPGGDGLRRRRARARARARGLLQHPGRSPRAAAATTATWSSPAGWACPTARPGCATVCAPPRRRPVAECAERMLAAGAAELLREAERELAA